MNAPAELPPIGTADRFMADVELLGWSAWTLAARLGLGSDRAARRWITGAETAPPAVAVWVGLIADFIRANPPPPRPPNPRYYPAPYASPIQDGMDGTPL